MSDPADRPVGFLRRWSRRKQLAETRPLGRGVPPQSADAEAGTPANAGAQPEPGQPPFDPATLPPIDSITVNSDIRAFLAPGVPEELTRAALRRVWMTDPAIRDFVGLAENQWDFTKPDGVPGFGALEFTPELRRILARLVGEQTELPPPCGEQDKSMAQAPEGLPRPGTDAAEDANPSLAKASPALRHGDAALQTNRREEEAAAPAEVHRRHGGALPK